MPPIQIARPRSKPTGHAFKGRLTARWPAYWLASPNQRQERRVEPHRCVTVIVACWRPLPTRSATATRLDVELAADAPCPLRLPGLVSTMVPALDAVTSYGRGGTRDVVVTEAAEPQPATAPAAAAATTSFRRSCEPPITRPVSAPATRALNAASRPTLRPGSLKRRCRRLRVSPAAPGVLVVAHCDNVAPRGRSRPRPGGCGRHGSGGQRLYQAICAAQL
jgi:hypothetical protein